MADFPEITQTRAKRPALLALSKGLAAFNRYANDPSNIIAQALPFSDKADRAGLTGGLSSLLGIPEAASLLEKLAYGDRLTSGAGQTLKPADDVVEGALTLAPVIGSGLAGANKVAAKVVAKQKPGQVNSLLGGLAGDDPALWLSHGSQDHQLLNSKGELIRELYNPSFAITRDKLSTFNGSNAVIVPWPDKLDPKNAKTLLTATDSYNPRWHASKAARFDNLPWDIDLEKGLADPRTAEFINQRLFEKLGSPFPKQGIKQEGNKDAPKGALPRLMQGMAGVTNRYSPVKDTNDWFSHRILMSPRFQSLESFAQSPYGGKLVGDISGQSQLERVKTGADALLNRLRVLDANGQPTILKGWDSPYLAQSGPSLIKGLASNTHPAELLSRRKDKNLTLLDELIVMDEAAPNGYRRLTPDEQREVQTKAGGLLKQAKTAPSDYAELKAYGPWQVSSDNVAGIVGRKSVSDDTLYKEAKKRGIPYEPADNAREEVEAAAWMLSRKKGDTPPLTRGLAGDLTRVNVGPSTNAGDYAASVEAVKAAHKLLKTDPTNSEALSAFQKAASNFKLDSDLFVQAGKITNAESGAMAKWLDKELAAFKPKSVVEPTLPSPTAPQKQIASMNFEEFSKVDIDSLNEKQLKAYIEAADTFKKFNFYSDETSHLWAVGKAEFNLEALQKAKGKTIDIDAEMAKMPPANNPFGLSSGMTKPAVKDHSMEDMIGMASGDLPWSGEKFVGTWPMESSFMKLNSQLTSSQAKKLEDIAFWVQLKKKNANTDLAEAWDDDIDTALKALLGK